MRDIRLWNKSLFLIKLQSVTRSNCFISLACVLYCSDDEDDTAELLAELQRIKKERAQEEARKVWFLLVSPWRWLGFINSYCSMLLLILSIACFGSSYPFLHMHSWIPVQSWIPSCIYANSPILSRGFLYTDRIISPGLLYRSPNLLDIKDNAYFGWFVAFLGEHFWKFWCIFMGFSQISFFF